METQSIISARVDRFGNVDRRDFLKVLGLGTAGLTLGWQDLLIAETTALRKAGKSVIVLWMQGGPSQFETFDPKPGKETGGPTKAIDTAVSGVKIAEYWPKVAQQMKDITLIRSMTNKEGNHQRATYQLHTGYVPNPTVKHPSFGSLVTSEIAPPDFDLPGFVAISGPSQNQGFLPVAYAPFRVDNPSTMPANSVATVPQSRFQRRLKLLGKLEESYAASGAARKVEEHLGLYDSASRLVTSPKIKAFDISQEKAEMRERYGNNAFGQGCMLARRLVEAGVTYVEVQLGGWDTHDDNNNRVAQRAAQCDPAFATLITDLKERGLFDSTLIVWMGEFGRTPKINPRNGRDHYPRAFNAAVAGCGLPGGMVLGKTNDTGADVADDPVSINDLFCTFCQRLGVDPRKENRSPLGRPMKIVDGGNPIAKLA